jgi:hypothetical protein
LKSFYAIYLTHLKVKQSIEERKFGDYQRNVVELKKKSKAENSRRMKDYAKKKWVKFKVKFKDYFLNLNITEKNGREGRLLNITEAQPKQKKKRKI